MDFDIGEALHSLPWDWVPSKDVAAAPDPTRNEHFSAGAPVPSMPVLAQLTAPCDSSQVVIDAPATVPLGALLFWELPLQCLFRSRRIAHDGPSRFMAIICTRGHHIPH